MSPIELNENNGIIATPHIPTLQVAAPVFAPDGKPFGLAIVDLDMRQAFDRIRASVRRSENIYVVDAQGNYLVHPDRAREFGAQLGVRADWRTDFPKLAAMAGSSEGIAQIIPDQAGQPGGAALQPAVLVGKEWIGIIETVPSAVFMAPAAAIKSTSLLVGLIAVLCAAMLAVFVANSLTQPITRLTAAVEGVGKSDSVAIPIHAGGETGVLARAFARVLDEANAKTDALQREVEEHRRTEVARDHYAARERLFSAAVESSNDAIVTKSLDGIITGWNPAAERTVRLCRQRSGRQKHRPDRAAEPAARRCMTSCAGSAGASASNITRPCGCAKDGRTVEVSLSISPIKDALGGYHRRLQDRPRHHRKPRTEQALRQQTEERRRIFETSQDLILVTDPEGNFVQVSPSADFDPRIPRRRKWSATTRVEFIHPDDLESTRKEMRRRGADSGRATSIPAMCTRTGRIVTLVLDGHLVGAGAAAFLHRPRHDRKPAGAGSAAARASSWRAASSKPRSTPSCRWTSTASILDWNSQAEKIFGWSRAEALGACSPS